MLRSAGETARNLAGFRNALIIREHLIKPATLIVRRRLAMVDAAFPALLWRKIRAQGQSRDLKRATPPRLPTAIRVGKEPTQIHLVRVHLETTAPTLRTMAAAHSLVRPAETFPDHRRATPLLRIATRIGKEPIQIRLGQGDLGTTVPKLRTTELRDQPGSRTFHVRKPATMVATTGPTCRHAWTGQLNLLGQGPA